MPTKSRSYGPKECRYTYEKKNGGRYELDLMSPTRFAALAIKWDTVIHHHSQYFQLGKILLGSPQADFLVR